ncbi:predicted protein [Botrytis cinerea T4]|uniref:Uncharacterized protein n=1 Tax=Botryotinia fuckeliana (strain T4) TaxID=999810 RepID=G2YSE3_BOTF4|nr:predicted protein [Botrytis cinerea T4]
MSAAKASISQTIRFKRQAACPVVYSESGDCPNAAFHPGGK